MTEKTISIAFQTDKRLDEYGPLAAAAEEMGFRTISVYNDMLFQPAWLPLAEMARQTSHARVGVAAINPFTCHPVNIAGNIALVDQLAPGRVYLGMARGGWLDFVGLAPSRVAASLREAMTCVRHLLRGDHSRLDQQLFPLAGGDGLRWDLPADEVPLLLGSWGENTIAMCSGLCDEVKIGGSASSAVAAHYSRLVYDRSGDDAPSIVMGAVTVVDDDGDVARALAKREASLYLPVVAELDPTRDFDPELLAAIRAAAGEYDFEHAGLLISDEMLSSFAIAGTPEEVASQCESLFDAGAARVELGTPHGRTTSRGLELLRTEVVPRLQSVLRS